MAKVRGFLSAPALFQKPVLAVLIRSAIVVARKPGKRIRCSEPSDEACQEGAAWLGRIVLEPEAAGVTIETNGRIDAVLIQPTKEIDWIHSKRGSKCLRIWELETC